MSPVTTNINNEEGYWAVKSNSIYSVYNEGNINDDMKKDMKKEGKLKIWQWLWLIEAMKESHAEEKV